jgi:hypothetical protein
MATDKRPSGSTAPRKRFFILRWIEFVLDWPLMTAEWLGKMAIAVWGRWPRKIAIPVVLVLSAIAIALAAFFWWWMSTARNGAS